MSSLSFVPRCILSIAVALSCTKVFIYCNINIPGGTVTFSEFKKLKCQVDVSEIESKPAQTLITCANSCAQDDSCSTVHYQSNTSKCMIDTRPVNTLVEHAVPYDDSFRSFLRYHYVCDDNWTLFDRSCYYVSPDFNTWTYCRHYCQNYESDLASIRSDREMNFALGILSVLPLDNKYIHIGGTRSPDNTWRWVNGEPWDYTKWDPREPTNVAGENYVAIFHLHAAVAWEESDWNDIQYYEKGYCLCEKSALTDFMEPSASCLTYE